jgi:hypothetical protein
MRLIMEITPCKPVSVNGDSSVIKVTSYGLDDRGGAALSFATAVSCPMDAEGFTPQDKAAEV